MNFYIGITDNDWFDYLSKTKPDAVNFWQPNDTGVFRRLSVGEPFLFKLRGPRRLIGGVGFFTRQSRLPLTMAWEVFGQDNGASTFEEFRQLILSKRRDNDSNPIIGCVVLSGPVFFSQEEWLPVPDDWSPTGIQQGKTYSVSTETGSRYWTRVYELLQKYLPDNEDEKENQLALENESPLYATSILRKVRIGQPAFRIMVTDAYNRKCAISNERTLPVLEAAHIKSYSQSGPNLIANALLLRSDLHKLFDSGYLTITKDLRVEVSKRIKEQFENGREYYKYHGSKLLNLPGDNANVPHSSFIQWHNDSIYQG